MVYGLLDSEIENTITAHGKCKQKYLNFVVLRNMGTKDCQIWKRFNLPVRVSCECFVDEMSFFSRYERERLRNRDTT
uniref:Uncharacterized protein n=1 Tax=Romanomermis culicivorax TaxID=13658 RepID=A0A915HX98_ROMCU